MEIIEHNVVEEELGSQHTQEKNERSKKMKGNGNRYRGSLASPVSGKLLCLTVWKNQKGFKEELGVVLK